MELELKSVKISLSQSEETTAFTGLLYINGQKVANVSNAGRGGAITLFPIGTTDYDLVKQANNYCKSLPAVKHDELLLDMDLEFWISLEVEKVAEKQSQQKFLKKIEKTALQNIVIGNPNDLLSGYRVLKLSTPISHYFLSQTGVEMLQAIIARVKTQMRPDEKILNTNIPDELK